MRVIGVTGGVGSGKSEVLNYIADKWNACVMETDQIGYVVMQPGRSCFAPIVELFGPAVLKEDGRLNREMIAEIVFRDKKKLAQLNAIVHPAVKKYITKAVERERANGTEYVFIESALLIEDHYSEIYDELWYIYSAEAERVERLMRDRQYTEDRIRSIMSNQLSEEEFSEECDFEVDNSGDFSDTMEQINRRMQRYETL